MKTVLYASIYSNTCVLFLFCRSSVGLIGIPADADTLHAVMRLCLRLTREQQFAQQFAELGGPKLLLQLTHASGFQGFTSLATLLFRHVLEEPRTLRHCFEKVVRSATVGTGSSLSGVAHSSMGSKELNYVLRVLGPAACRCPEVFREVASDCLRVALSPTARGTSTNFHSIELCSLLDACSHWVRKIGKDSIPG